MIKHDRFSRHEYAFNTLKKETLGRPVHRGAGAIKKPQTPNPAAESLREKKTAPRIAESATNSSRLSRGSKLEDLCEEDKSKIG